MATFSIMQDMFPLTEVNSDSDPFPQQNGYCTHFRDGSLSQGQISPYYIHKNNTGKNFNQGIRVATLNRCKPMEIWIRLHSTGLCRTCFLTRIQIQNPKWVLYPRADLGPCYIHFNRGINEEPMEKSCIVQSMSE